MVISRLTTDVMVTETVVNKIIMVILAMVTDGNSVAMVTVGCYGD